MTSLTRKQIARLLDELARRLAAAGVGARIYVVGGAAMELDWDSRRSTHDIDAVLAPAVTVRTVAAEMATDLALADDWLSDAVTAFVPPQDPHANPRVHASHGDVQVVTAPAEHLLARKMAAFRQTDMVDLRVLIAHLALRTAEEVVAVCERAYGPDSVVLPEHDELLWQAGIVLDT